MPSQVHCVAYAVMFVVAGDAFLLVWKLPRVEPFPVGDYRNRTDSGISGTTAESVVEPQWT